MVEVINPSFTYLTDSKPSFVYNSGKKNDNTHIANNMDHYNTFSENKHITRKASKVSPSEFDDWVQSQGGEKNFTALANLTTSLPSKRKSFLSNVSYSSEDSDNKDIDYTSSIICTEDSVISRQQPLEPYSKILNKNGNSLSDEPIDSNHLKKRKSKKFSWFTCLFQKQCKHTPNKETSTKRTFSVSNFFCSKKKTRKEQVVLSPERKDNIPIQLPLRYPISMERVIYHISSMRLSNSRRPLRHQVMISNMLFQYNNLIQSEMNTLVFSGRLQYQNSYIYEQPT